MIRRRTFLTSAGLALVALALGSCGYRREDFRYRMTVEVETPQGLRSGSSVIEVKLSNPGRGPYVLPQAGTTAKVRGEAVTVDLPGGKVLFALLSKPGFHDGAVQFPFDGLKPKPYHGEYAPIRQAEELKGIRGIGELPKEAFPMLVTFDDLSDPATAREVDPDDLAASFGEGVKLRRITVEMTSESVTTGIEKRLRWLTNQEIMTNPGWAKLPYEARLAIIGLRKNW